MPGPASHHCLLENNYSLFKVSSHHCLPFISLKENIVSLRNTRDDKGDGQRVSTCRVQGNGRQAQKGERIL